MRRSGRLLGDWAVQPEVEQRLRQRNKQLAATGGLSRVRQGRTWETAREESATRFEYKPGALASEQELAASHPLLKIAEMDRKGAVARTEKAEAVVRAKEAKERVVNFYRWARSEWFIRWASRLAGLVLAYLCFWTWVDDLRIHRLFDAHAAAYKESLDAKLAELRAASAERRRRLVADVAAFGAAHPRPAPEELRALRDSVAAYFAPRMVSSVEVWSRFLEEREQERAAQRRAYEEAQGTAAERYSSRRILREGRPADAAAEPAQTPYGKIQPPPKEQARREKLAKDIEEGQALNRSLDDFANTFAAQSQPAPQQQTKQ